MDDLEDYPTPIGPNYDILIVSDEDVVFLQQCGISLEGTRREKDVFPYEDV
jgi:hypothetical protein